MTAIQNKKTGRYHCGSVVMNPTSTHEDAGSIHGPTQCCGCSVGWAAATPIRPLDWEYPYAIDVALKTKKKKIKIKIKIEKLKNKKTK